MMRTKILTITLGVCFAVATAQPSLAQRFPGLQHSETELENMRTQLLALTDTVGKFAPLFPPGYVDVDKLATASDKIKQMPYPQLDRLRQNIDPSTVSTRLQGAQKA